MVFFSTPNLNILCFFDDFPVLIDTVEPTGLNPRLVFYL